MSKNIAILHPHVSIKWWAIKTLLYIANFLQDENEVHFFTLQKNTNICFPELSEKINIETPGFFEIPGLKMFNLLFISWQIRKYDVIIAGNSPMHFVSVLAKFFNKITFCKNNLKIIRFIQNIPFYYVDNKNPGVFEKTPGLIIKKFLEKNIIKYLDIIVSNSSFIQNKIKEIFSLNSTIIYPPVDTDFFMLSKTPGFKKSTPGLEFKIFTYSRLVKGKNIELAIKTFFNLSKKYPELKLYIWWDGEERNKLEKMACGNPNIIFLWELNWYEIRQYLSLSSIFLFTSVIDAFGLSITEAMSMWVPVVSLALWWAPDIIDSSVNWFLASDENDFIDKTRILLENEALRLEFANKWKILVESKFSLTSMKRQVLDLIK